MAYEHCMSDRVWTALSTASGPCPPDDLRTLVEYYEGEPTLGKSELSAILCKLLRQKLVLKILDPNRPDRAVNGQQHWLWIAVKKETPWERRRRTMRKKLLPYCPKCHAPRE